MASAIAEAAQERREILQLIAQQQQTINRQQDSIDRQQSEIRGIQTENRHILDILLNRQNPQEDNPDN
jgi:septal ring factor EnvC (AmiA/AmiB activator)